MKNLQISFFFSILFTLSSIISNAQELKYSDLSTGKFKSYTFDSYVSKDGAVYKIGDILEIGTPSTNKSFAYVNVEDIFAPSSKNHSDVNVTGKETAIKKIYIVGYKRTGYSAAFKTKGSIGLSTYIIDIENAIAAGEIKSFGMTSDEALDNLKKSKDKLDLGLITQEKYDSVKVEMVKYIK